MTRNQMTRLRGCYCRGNRQNPLRRCYQRRNQPFILGINSVKRRKRLPGRRVECAMVLKWEGSAQFGK